MRNRFWGVLRESHDKVVFGPVFFVAVECGGRIRITGHDAPRAFLVLHQTGTVTVSGNTISEAREIQMSNSSVIRRTNNKWIIDDPVEILQSVKMRISKAIDKATADGYNFDNGLKAIGVTDKRKTTIICNESTGVPLYNVIVMMDVRTTLICRPNIGTNNIVVALLLLPAACHYCLATATCSLLLSNRNMPKKTEEKESAQVINLQVGVASEELFIGFHRIHVVNSC
ncbi:glycerol kinase [Tanacetum coccineum]